MMHEEETAPAGWHEFIAWIDDPDADPGAYIFTSDRGWISNHSASPAPAPPPAPRKRSPRPLPSPAPSTRMLTLAEASELIRTPSETIRYWIWQGRLEAFRPGRAVLVREAELLALVESRETRRIRAARGKGPAGSGDIRGQNHQRRP